MIIKPIIILGAPRSGTTILHRCLVLHQELWQLAGESHGVLEGPFHPARKGYESNVVTSADLNNELITNLQIEFYRSAINLNFVLKSPATIFTGNSLYNRILNKLSVIGAGRLSQRNKPRGIRLLEKTPKNTLRVQMLNRLFPDALYVHITREAESNIDSLIAGWLAVDRIGPFRRQRFATYPIASQLHIQQYHSRWWNFALVPEWRKLKGKTIGDVAAWQYHKCNSHSMIDLASIEARRVFTVHYEEFVKHPVEISSKIFEWADLPPSSLAEDFARALPRINDTTHGAGRQGARLRYPDEVYGAIDRCPDIECLDGSPELIVKKVE